MRFSVEVCSRCLIVVYVQHFLDQNLCEGLTPSGGPVQFPPPYKHRLLTGQILLLTESLCSLIFQLGVKLVAIADMWDVKAWEIQVNFGHSLRRGSEDRREVFGYGRTSLFGRQAGEGLLHVPYHQ